MRRALLHAASISALGRSRPLRIARAYLRAVVAFSAHYARVTRGVPPRLLVILSALGRVLCALRARPSCCGRVLCALRARTFGELVACLLGRSRDRMDLSGTGARSLRIERVSFIGELVACLLGRSRDRIDLSMPSR